MAAGRETQPPLTQQKTAPPLIGVVGERPSSQPLEGFALLLYPRLIAFATSLRSRLEFAMFPSCVADSFYPREEGDYGYAPAASADLDDTTPQGEN